MWICSRSSSKTECLGSNCLVYLLLSRQRRHPRGHGVMWHLQRVICIRCTVKTGRASSTHLLVEGLGHCYLACQRVLSYDTANQSPSVCHLCGGESESILRLHSRWRFRSYRVLARGYGWGSIYDGVRGLCLGDCMITLW